MKVNASRVASTVERFNLCECCRKSEGMSHPLRNDGRKQTDFQLLQRATEAPTRTCGPCVSLLQHTSARLKTLNYFKCYTGIYLQTVSVRCKLLSSPWISRR